MRRPFDPFAPFPQHRTDACASYLSPLVPCSAIERRRMLSVFCGEGDSRGSNVHGLPLNLCCLFVPRTCSASRTSCQWTSFATPARTCCMHQVLAGVAKEVHWQDVRDAEQVRGTKRQQRLRGRPCTLLPRLSPSPQNTESIRRLSM